MADIIIKPGRARPAIVERLLRLETKPGDLVVVQVPAINPDEADQLRAYCEELLPDRAVMITDRAIANIIAHSFTARQMLRRKLDEADARDHTRS